MADCRYCGVANDDDSVEWYMCASCAAELKASTKIAKRAAERLQVDPQGSDKIDELEQALEFMQFKLRVIEKDLNETLGEAERWQEEALRLLKLRGGNK